MKGWPTSFLYAFDSHTFGIYYKSMCYPDLQIQPMGKKRAVYEMLGQQLQPHAARKFFYNVYEFLLYNDTEGFLKTMEYRLNIERTEGSEEDYLVFKFMLQYMQAKHPRKISMLLPEMPHPAPTPPFTTARLSSQRSGTPQQIGQAATGQHN